MGWAKQAAQEIQTIVDERIENQKWTMFSRKEIEAQSDILWAELAGRVIADTQEFDEARRHKSGLRAEHLTPNNVTVQRYLRPLKKLEFIYTRHLKVTVFWNGEPFADYRFGVDDSGSVWFVDEDRQQVAVEDVSRASFEQLIELYKRALL
ncbi:MAG: hypothetical protein ABSF70_20480 [Terracidiphilus sp.]|jgi:hypothetical protein